MLRESPYVLDVTPSIVHFLAQFKALFYEGLQSGKAPAEIVAERGIDPEVLGVNRVNGLKTMVLKGGKAGKGFRDLNSYGMYLEHLLTPEAKIRLLEQKLAYRDQIIEYHIKNRILRAGRGGVMDAPANAKYTIVRETSQRVENLLSVKRLYGMPRPSCRFKH